MAHVPAIRDQPYPSPKDHQNSLAFNAKRTTFRIITTARAWSWASIIILLMLVRVRFYGVSGVDRSIVLVALLVVQQLPSWNNRC